MCGIRCAVCVIPKVQSLTVTQSKPRKAAFSQLFPVAVTFAKIPQTIFKAAGGRGRHFVLCRD